MEEKAVRFECGCLLSGGEQGPVFGVRACLEHAEQHALQHALREVVAALVVAHRYVSPA